MIPSTAELLLKADQERPRTQQKSLGMSDLGGCRRKAGYTIHGYPHEQPSGSVQAVIGTAVHDAVTSALRKMRAEGLIPSDSVIDEEVRFGGITGHPDLYVRPMLRDVKTIGYDIQVANMRVKGPSKQNLWQVMTYGAALIVRGLPVEEVQLDYLVRDSGKTWLWSGPFNYMLVSEAMVWLDLIRQTPLDWLARDYAPDSAQCKNCPFFSRCWEGHVPGRDERSVLLSEDQDGAYWAKRLMEARELKKKAEAEEALCKGALDALRPNTEGRGEVRVQGFPYNLRWTVTRRRSLDTDQVRQDYEAAGSSPPLRGSESIKLELVAPKEEP
jgi:hypothetical protein